MKRFMLCCLSLVLILNVVVYADDALPQVLELYGIKFDGISINEFISDLDSAKDSYFKLKDQYDRDEFFRLIQDVAENTVPVVPEVTMSVEVNELYLRSLVDIEADLEYIFEAERDYRLAVQITSENRIDNSRISLEAFGLSGISSDEVNNAVDIVTATYDKFSSVVVFPDIGSLENLRIPLVGNYRITSEYGYRKNPFTGEGQEFHNGLDIGADTGTEIQALFAGRVLFAGNKNDGHGNYVLLSHSNELQTLYAHMSIISVSTGDMVEQYDKIGEVGSTGRSTGSHLHLGMFVNGQKVDPSVLFNTF